MARLVPIPDSMLQRLAALDARCDISLRRHESDVEVARGRGVWPRRWTISIERRGRGAADRLVVSAPTLCRALELALPQAERRWGVPGRRETSESARFDAG